MCTTYRKKNVMLNIDSILAKSNPPSLHLCPAAFETPIDNAIVHFALIFLKHSN